MVFVYVCVLGVIVCLCMCAGSTATGWKQIELQQQIQTHSLLEITAIRPNHGLLLYLHYLEVIC